MSQETGHHAWQRAQAFGGLGIESIGSTYIVGITPPSRHPLLEGLIRTSFGYIPELLIPLSSSLMGDTPFVRDFLLHRLQAPEGDPLRYIEAVMASRNLAAAGLGRWMNQGVFTEFNNRTGIFSQGEVGGFRFNQSFTSSRGDRPVDATIHMTGTGQGLVDRLLTLLGLRSPIGSPEGLARYASNVQEAGLLMLNPLNYDQWRMVAIKSIEGKTPQG